MKLPCIKTQITINCNNIIMILPLPLQTKDTIALTYYTGYIRYFLFVYIVKLLL